MAKLRKPSLTKIFLGFCLAILALGCSTVRDSPGPVDISLDLEMWGKYKQGQVYRTTVDLFALRSGPHNSLELAVGKDDDPKGRAFRSRASVSTKDWTPRSALEGGNLTDYPGLDIRTVKRGTRLRVQELRELEYKAHPGVTFRFVVADFPDGDFLGTQVNLINLSEYRLLDNPRRLVLVGPDPFFLVPDSEH